jgi:hypothetical protein
MLPGCQRKNFLFNSPVIRYHVPPNPSLNFKLDRITSVAMSLLSGLDRIKTVELQETCYKQTPAP